MTQSKQIGELEEQGAVPAVPVPVPALQASTTRNSRLRSVFSFPVMCMFLLSAVIFAYAPRGITIGESDIWWHLLNARHLVLHHSFPRIDTYSFTAAGSRWISYEWISELLFLAAFRTAGLQGLVILYATLIVLIFAAVYYRSWRAGADCKDAAVATLGGVCIGCVSLAPRMLLFGWLCLTGVLLVLDHFRRTGRGLWLLPPLFLLWINLHGSWVYGMVVLVLTILSGLVQGQWHIVEARRWTPAELRKLLIAMAASGAALFVNPFGYKLVLYPLDLIFRQQQIVQTVQYWLPVDFSTWNGKLALGTIFAVLAAALFSSRRWRLDEILLAAFALWSGLSHVRFLDFAAIIIVPILAPRLRLFSPYDAAIDKPWLNAAIMSCAVAAVIFFFPTKHELQVQLDREYPTAAVKFMQSHHLEGRIFNSVEFGGYMEWSSPELKPFIDGREDIFIYNGTFDDYMRTVTLQHPGDVLAKYGIEYILLERAWPLAYVLQGDPSWHLIYSDDVAVLFGRDSARTTGPSARQ